MSKPILGIVLGAVLGLLDGATAWFTPAVRDQMATILMGSSFKGIIAGAAIGLFAYKVNDLKWSVIFGLCIAALVSLPFAMATDPATGQTYFWEILLPGSLVGLVVGYATQRYGVAKKTA